MAFVWLGMNVENGPLANLRLRHALRLGVDVDQMLLASEDAAFITGTSLVVDGGYTAQ